jgi:uncharacterized protein YbaR (Trm112 family)
VAADILCGKAPALQEVIVPASQVLSDPLRCPGCKGQTFTINGFYRRSFRQVVKDGAKELEELGEDTFLDIEVLICPKCQVKYLISDDMTYRLYHENHNLRAEVEALTGMCGSLSTKPPN